MVFIVVAMVPSMEAEDMLLTSAPTADQPIRDEAVPEHTPPTVNVEPVSTRIDKWPVICHKNFLFFQFV